MKKLLIIVLFLSIPVLAQADKQPTKEELLVIGAKQQQGTVTNAGAYNFLIAAQDGKEVNFITDDTVIQFIPENERLMVGDQVNVIYIEAHNASGSVDKTHAMLVEFIHKVERKFLDGKITCFLTPLKYRSGNTCFVKEINQIIRFEGRQLGDPWAKTGQEITIKIKAVPASIGNGYIYQATPVE